MTDTTTKWATHWVAALNEMPNIDRDREVDTGTYTYKYATLGNVIEQVREILSNHNWAFVQDVTAEGGMVAVTTRFYHVSGQELVYGPLRLNAGSTAQQAGSAITYARRYALTAALGLATEDDDDGAAASQQFEVEQPTPPGPAEWLAMRVTMFAKWSEDARRDAYTEAMEALEIERFQTMEHAESVFEWMKNAYYQAHPPSESEAPF